MKIYILSFIIVFMEIGSIYQAQGLIISAEVRENIKSRVDNSKNTSIVIGAITPHATTYLSCGVKSLKTKELVDENSIFKIGNFSKTFAGVLLAERL